MNSKWILKTKTLWLNILCAVIIASWNYFFPDHKITVDYATMAQSTMNIINRFWTSEPAHLI